MTHILLTRPLEASRQLASRLAGSDIQSIVMPLYTFSPRRPGLDMHKTFSGQNGRKLVVFTSTRAVEFGLQHIPSQQLKELEFAAVGDATRKQLEAAGRQVHLRAATGYTSEDLLAMTELAESPGDAVIFCAPGGRKALAEGLAALGWNVTNALVYERLELQPTQEQIGEITAADRLLSVWTSVSALEVARKHLPSHAWEKILNAPMLVISARIKHHLQQLGASDIELADGPGNAGLLQSIRQIIT
jgi:uroporphyrinogen-III synthase